MRPPKLIARPIVLLLLGGCMVRVPLSPQTVADQTWAGTIRCDAMPRFSTLALRESVTLAVRDGTARFTRDVLQPDTSRSSGYQETSAGPVAADGHVTLSGQGRAAGAEYTAEYGGVLRQDAGAEAALTGHQTWRFRRDGASLERPCTLSLRRAG